MIPSLFSRSVVAAATSIALIGGASVAVAQEKGKDSVVATVNGKNITTTEMGFITSELGPRLVQLSPDQRKEALTTVLIDLELVAQAAEKQGLQNGEAFKKQIAFLTKRALRNEYFRLNVDEKITDADLKAFYDKEIGSQPAPWQLTARHILKKDKKEAEAIIAELKKGGDFAKIAEAKSEGPSKSRGGSLGTFGPKEMTPPFEKAALALKPGTFSQEPVQTSFGWHVILVEDKKDLPKPAFEQLKPQLRGAVANQKFSELLDGLKKKAKIEVK